MATHLDKVSHAQTVNPLPIARWAGLVALLLVEGLAIGCLVITYRYNKIATYLTAEYTQELVQSLLAPASLAAAVTLLFCSAWLRGGLRGGQTKLFSPPHRSWCFLVLHVVVFVGFFWLTYQLSRAHFDRTLQATWMVFGLATVASWGMTVTPAVRRALCALVAAFTVGLVGWCILPHARIWLWELLGRPTLWLVHGLLSLAYQDTVCREADFVVGTSSFMVRVEGGCSGYEGIGLIWVFLSVYLWLFRRELRFPQALLLLPIGTALIYLANAVRIAALVAVGIHVSPAVAVDGFHSQAGWLMFIALSLGLIACSRRILLFAPPDRPSTMAGALNPTAVYLAPLLALTATVMITAAFTSGFDRYYPLRVVAVAGVIWFFRAEYARWGLNWSWPAVVIGVTVFALWMALECTYSDSASGAAIAAGLADLPRGWGTTWLIFRVVGSVLTVPFAEELAFRGYLTRRLITADFERVPFSHFTWLSFFVSSAAFGVLHGRWLAGTFAGMLYAVALYRRGSLADAVVAHATTNALIAAYVLATGTWSLWA